MSDALALIHAANKLLMLFDRGSRPRSHLVDALPLALPFLRGSLTFRRGRIPARYVQAAKRAKLVGASNESAGHLALKAAAKSWMKAEGAKDALEEQWCFTGKADVYSEKHRWAVECGDTGLHKLQAFILARRDGSPVRLTLVPYRFDPSLGARGHLAVEIGATPDAARDLSSYSRRALGDIYPHGGREPRPAGYRVPFAAFAETMPVPALPASAGRAR